MSQKTNKKNEIGRSGYVANNSVCMKRCSLNIRGVSMGEAGRSPPSLRRDWSVLQQENKHSGGSLKAPAEQGPHTEPEPEHAQFFCW